jgi:hypothetical protein
MSFMWLGYLAAGWTICLALDCSGGRKPSARRERPTPMTSKRPALAAGLLAALALLIGACASPDGQGAASGGTSPPTTATPATGGPTGSTSREPRDLVKVQVTGTVREGVEPGCLILDTGRERFLLLSQDKSKLAVGSRVEVTGVRASGRVSYCQQGIPLEVRTVRPA